jgi:hypothetical protein
MCRLWTQPLKTKGAQLRRRSLPIKFLFLEMIGRVSRDWFAMRERQVRKVIAHSSLQRCLGNRSLRFEPIEAAVN